MRSFVSALLGALALTGCLSGADDSDTRRLYESCRVESGECTAAADGCYLIHNGQVSRAMCSNECDTDDDCIGGECGPLAGDVSEGNICYRSCEADDECLAGFSCQATDHG